MATLIQYNENEYEIKENLSFEDCLNAKVEGRIGWINLDGTETADFSSLISKLELHPLMVEDMHNRAQLPKFESFENIDFLSIQMLKNHGISMATETEHLSILIASDFLITVQELKAGDVFDNVRLKIKNNYKRIAKNGIDYLFLSLVDAIVDAYLIAMYQMRQPMEDMEMLMVKRPGLNYMSRIISFKTELSNLRKFTSPLREEMQRIRVENPNLIKKHNQALFRDILDHLNTLNANFESQREMLRDLADLHWSNQNLVLGNTMKTLTVISAIFIPLTFIVGVYGMNFDYMPWLHARYGFWIIGVFMAVVAGILIGFMKKKKWF